jgi:hypothetical protein
MGDVMDLVELAESLSTTHSGTVVDLGKLSVCAPLTSSAGAALPASFAAAPPRSLSCIMLRRYTKMHFSSLV